MLQRILQCSISGQALASLRTMATATRLKYDKFGEPTEVLYLCEEEVEGPKEGEVLVKILAASINPADINTIQGKYPVKPKFPAIGGNEGVAEIVTVGPGVTKVKAGDRVVPFTTGLGMWTSHAKFCEKDLMKIPSQIGIPEAATITVNPPTAYRMLKDFVDLKPGDTVIQNGANSAAGQAVHQLCKAWGINSVGVVRNRPEIEDLRCYLKCLGATEVLTEEELRTTTIFESQLKKPILGLNCVGGKNAMEITRKLGNKGVLVTYGGMSREPLTVPTAALIFKDIAFRGFWMTRWSKDNFDSPERTNMFGELFSMIQSEQFKGPVHELVPAKNFKGAMEQAINFKGFTGKKFILDFSIVI